jgi:CRISPR-associated exonuclease Cas4
MLIAAIGFTLLALCLFWLAARMRRSSGLPAGRVIYSDTSEWSPIEQSLYDRELGLTGKPDYLVQNGELIIPVEVKSSRAPSAPLDGHILQLAAYCLLVHRQLGRRPPYGILHYSNRTFAVDYTEQLERSTLDLIAELHQKNRLKELNRSHVSTARCSRCGYRANCEQRLL